MRAYSRLLSILLMAALVALIVPAQTQANEYKWLNASKYEKIFVYTDFKECTVVADQLNEAIKIILLRSGIKPAISDSLVFQTNDEGGESITELLNSQLIDNHKIFLYIYGRCLEYGSVYIYQFDIHFAVFDKKNSNALLFSSPRHSVFGADKINGVKKAFKKLIEDAVADYLSANMKNTK